MEHLNKHQGKIWPIQLAFTLKNAKIFFKPYLNKKCNHMAMWLVSFCPSRWTLNIVLYWVITVFLRLFKLGDPWQCQFRFHLSDDHCDVSVALRADRADSLSAPDHAGDCTLPGICAHYSKCPKRFHRHVRARGGHARCPVLRVNSALRTRRARILPRKLRF